MKATFFVIAALFISFSFFLRKDAFSDEGMFTAIKVITGAIGLIILFFILLGDDELSEKPEKFTSAIGCMGAIALLLLGLVDVFMTFVIPGGEAFNYMIVVYWTSAVFFLGIIITTAWEELISRRLK